MDANDFTKNLVNFPNPYQHICVFFHSSFHLPDTQIGKIFGLDHLRASNQLRTQRYRYGSLLENQLYTNGRRAEPMEWTVAQNSQHSLESKAENITVTAEQTRVEAEQPRVKAEKTLVKAKQTRVKAEKTRVKAKQTRVKAQQTSNCKEFQPFSVLRLWTNF